MNAMRRIWPAALVILLMPALTLLSSSSAEAKRKPKPPPAVWAIEIPLCAEAGPNLCGVEQTVYEDGGYEDGLGIRVTSGNRDSRFGFAIYRCLPDEQCYDEEPPMPAPMPVYLQDIHIDAIPPVEENPCEFPGTNGDESSYCRDLEPPLCMECFLNGPHPHWADQSGADYRSFSFELAVFNYDYAASPHPFDGVGYLSIEVYNTDETLIPPDNWDDHNIFGDNWELPTDVKITKPETDSWTVEVTVTEPMLFREWYRGCARDPNPQGKCPTETKLPLDAQSTTVEIAFQVTWTRIPSGD